MRSAFFKLGARRYLVISIVMVAVALDVVEGVVRDARIAVGACSAVAQRIREAERRLIGAPARPGLGRVDRGAGPRADCRRSTTSARPLTIVATPL